MKITKLQLKKLIKEEYRRALGENIDKMKALASEMGGDLQWDNNEPPQAIIYFDVEPAAYPPGTDTSDFQYEPNERNNPEAGGILYTGYFA